MRRTYTCFAIACADRHNAGLVVSHADDGTGNKAPLLFRNIRRAQLWIQRNSEINAIVEPVEVTVEVVRKEKGIKSL